MQEPQFVKQLFSSIARRYDLANHLLSGGLDYFWRRRAAQIVASWQPRLILDLATGSGDLALTLQKHCPEAELLGADFCHPMLVEAQKKGLQELVVADGMKLPFASDSFDVLTVAFGLRNMASWRGALSEMHRVLRPGGHLLVLDFSMPKGPWRFPYSFYLHRILPKIAGLLTGEKSAYEYLGDSIERFPSGNAMLELLLGAGFLKPVAEPLSLGIVSLYTASK